MAYPGLVTAGVLGLGLALGGTAVVQERGVAHDSGNKRTNRLARATSPYLLQHASNPVDWHEWGPEALELARREDKPIFLSIGYSACHWCHVMAHESFEDAETAALMNRLFVNVKVDREERPDLDEIYMQATMILNQGQGGWPMSVWLSPDLKPFFAGTYFPPESRWGRPGFRDLCERVGELWGTHREALLADGDKLTSLVRQSLAAGEAAAEALSLADVDHAADVLSGVFDAVDGGLPGGGSNKFPPSMAMDLMLRSAARSPDEARRRRLVGLVELTLTRMARGGIYDHLAGGIARYSTDRRWLVPHFEKMLYDQALVSGIYLDAHLATGQALYAEVARDLLDYVIADLQSPAGGFYSARDADSEGKEGEYYVWTRAQVIDALGQDEGALFCDLYDVSDAGNWDDPHDPGVVKNILNLPLPPEEFAQRRGLDPLELNRRMAAARQRLLEVRARRVPPARDEKVLCEWNGLMISSMARGGAILAEPRFIDAARRAAGAILETQYRDGRLHRAARDGRSLPMAFLSDYACMIEGLLDLYEATFERRWLDAAVELNQAVVKHYADRERGGFFFTSHDHESLIARARDVRDGAVPSGNSLQLMNLLRLGVITGDAELRTLAESSMRAFAADVRSSPGSGERFLRAAEFARVGPVEIAIVGDPSAPATQALLRAVNATFLPNRVLLLLDPARPQDAPRSPLLEGRGLVDGRPAAYVCRSYACRRPVTRPEELLRELGGGP